MAKKKTTEEASNEVAVTPDVVEETSIGEAVVTVEKTEEPKAEEPVVVKATAPAVKPKIRTQYVF